MSPEPAGTLVVVDDHARFRQAVRELLTAAGWRILGEAAAGADALEVAGRLAPDVVLLDVVLLDVVLPDMDGFAVAEHLAAAGCVSAVVLTSGHDRRDFAGRALAALLAGGRP